MKKKIVISVLLAMMLMIVATAHGYTWSRIKAYTNRVVNVGFITCYTFPNEHAAIQRVRLKPLLRNSNLTVSGFNNGSWTTIGSRSFSGLTQEVIRVPSGTYSYFQACVSTPAAAGATYSLFYEVGT